MNDPVALPEGSTFVKSQEFDEYRIDLYIRPDGLIHTVLRPKKYADDGTPARAQMFKRFHELSVEALGKPAEKYSIEE